VQLNIHSIHPRGWVQISIKGEDEKAALHFLAKGIGICKTHVKQIEKFSEIKGRTIFLNENRKLMVDIGVVLPQIIDATISRQQLQAQLTDGRKLPLKKIIEHYGLCKNFPLTVKIIEVNEERSYVKAMLSESQLQQYRRWRQSLLDRLIIIGASHTRIKFALKRGNMWRDVIQIESLGMLEHAVICKLGTDAVGLIPKIGEYLRDAALAPFNWKKVKEISPCP
jgi:hypothetical protein